MRNPKVLALAQIQPILGDVLANRDKHLEWIDQARQQGASAIVFPELGLTGYQVQDLTVDVAKRLDDPVIQDLVRASSNLDVAFSFVEETPDYRFYISAVYAVQGEVQSVHRKVYLPTYGMFDEGRYFARGAQFRTFPTRLGNAGMLICEDAWHTSAPYLLAVGGSNLMILMSSSPARSVGEEDTFGSHRFWKRLLEVYSQLFGVHIAFVNRVGFEDGINFFGGSSIIAPDGTWLQEGPLLEEALIMAEIDEDRVRRARFAVPLLRDERPDLVMQELKRIEALSERFEFR